MPLMLPYHPESVWKDHEHLDAPKELLGVVGRIATVEPVSGVGLWGAPVCNLRTLEVLPVGRVPVDRSQ